MSRLDALQTVTKWTQAHAQELNAIDHDFTSCRLQAEECSQPRHSFPWSPTLHLAFIIHQYWTIRASALRRGQDDSTAASSLVADITRIQSTVSLPDDFDQSHLQELGSNSIWMGLKGARRLLRHVNKQAQALRLCYLATAAELAALQ